MFGAIVGYILCIGAALFTVCYEAYLLKKYTNFPKEKQCFKTFFYIILIPFIINTLYTILAFVMMAKIPSFSWWMVLLFIGITTTNFNFELPILANVRPFCAFILLWVNIPDAVKVTALLALIIAEILKWIDSWMEKKAAKEAEEADKLAKELGLNNAEELLDGLDDLNKDLDDFAKEQDSKKMKKTKSTNAKKAKNEAE